MRRHSDVAKVLHISFSDGPEGAGRAARRLHDALVGKGLDSHMLVARSAQAGTNVIVHNSFLARLNRWVGNRVARALLKRQHTRNTALRSLNIFPSAVPRIIHAMDADIVNLHAIHGELLSIHDIAMIRRPIVWTLHDMWAFSGAEHYEDMHAPGRSAKGYARGNRPDTDHGLDLDRWIWLRKTRLWQHRSFHLVAPSHWMANAAANSVLFDRLPVTMIHNGLDLDCYCPRDPVEARVDLKLPGDVNLVLFGEMKATRDRRKGYHLLHDALAVLAADPHHLRLTHLAVFGTDAPPAPSDMALQTHGLGTFRDEPSLAQVYAAADVFVAPSLQDNLPNTVAEALACGTPVVAFNVGGMSDLIKHMQNGYLAQQGNPEDLAHGIRWILESAERRHQLSSAARATAEARFDVRDMACHYEALYQATLQTRPDLHRQTPLAEPHP